MNTSHLSPAFRYQLKDYFKGFASFFATIALIVAASLFANRFFSGTITFSGFGMISAICLLVLGIVEPRPNLRICIQLGVSRRTAFFTQLPAVALSAAALAAGGELLLALGQALAGHGSNVAFTDLYALIYLHVGEHAFSLSLWQHFVSILFNLALMMCMFALGMFFTFLFWRLSKLWTIVAAISIPLLLNGVPALAYYLGLRFPAVARVLAAFGTLLVSSVWSMIAFLLLLGALLTLISWLLVRRANLRAPQGK